MAAPTPTAPRMPRGYGVPTDASGAELVPWSWAVDRLTSARNYWLCTTRADGRPHAAPVWGVWLDDAVWFSTDPASQKGRNLARSPEAVVHLESGDETVILEGAVERIQDRETLAPVVAAYADKYGILIELGKPGYGMYVLRPRAAQTWTEADFPRSAVRWVF